MDDAIFQLIGEKLAAGWTNEEIIDVVTHETMDRALAIKYLRTVYDRWQTTVGELNIREEELINWHAFIRMQLLKDALKDETIQGKRFALQVVDSLAAIQGVGGQSQLSFVPLSVNFVPKQEKPNAPDTPDANSTEPQSTPQ